jgi:hypothetical protein
MSSSLSSKSDPAFTDRTSPVTNFVGKIKICATFFFNAGGDCFG